MMSGMDWPTTVATPEQMAAWREGFCGNCHAPLDPTKIARGVDGDTMATAMSCHHCNAIFVDVQEP